MIRIVIVIVGLVCATLVPRSSVVSERFSLPPGDNVISFASLGREEAAGAFLWILTTQQAGRELYAQQGYPYLEVWLETVFRHNPQLTDAYTLGTVLLLTDRDRAPTMERLLSQAATRYPDNHEYPMLQGMSAYFGQLDAARAAEYFDRAAAIASAPPYLKLFADRLHRDANDCGVMVVNMKAMADVSTQVSAMKFRIEGVYLRCLERELKQAAASYRLNNNKTATIKDLIDAGYLKGPPPAPPGQCWEVQGASVVLVPCIPASP